MKDYYKNISSPEISSMLSLTNNPPRIEEIWALMDLAWAVTKADPACPESMERFYSHPVWTLNGIFTETHEESIYNRQIFSDAIATLKPKRIADYGGGVGAFARILAQKLPNATIEIIEPFPSELAIKLCKKYPNIIFVKELSGLYDVIVAIDVLEHIQEPLNLVYSFAQHLHKESHLLLANCFYPVIRCHLSCTFYLRYSFDFLLKKIGFIKEKKLLYAGLYSPNSRMTNPQNIKSLIIFSKIIFSCINSIHTFYKNIRDVFKTK